MAGYKNILVAVDLSPDTTFVLDKACEIGRLYGAELSVVHVMQPLAVGYTLALDAQFESLYVQATRQCRSALVQFGTDAGIPEHRAYNLLGSTGPEVRSLAKKLDADLIVVGGHGKHGFELLLGSTSGGISHGIECDVLIVRIQPA